MVQAIDVGEVEGISIFGNDGVPNVGPSKGPEAELLLSDIDGFFTENKGQLGQGAGAYYCQGSPLSVAFGTGWVAYDLQGEGDEGVMFRLTFEGANTVEPVGVNPLPHRNNYFIGNDPEGWVTGARNYREVLYSGLYDGIDLRYHLSDDMLKYDFLLEPGTDASLISINYDGVEALSIDDGNGALLIATSVGSIRDEAPVAFQDGPGGRTAIPAAFRYIDGTTIRIEVDEYDRELPMIIDPGIIFSTYLGGSDFDGNHDMYVDAIGDVYIVGRTRSGDFPTTAGSYMTSVMNGSQEGYVIKFKSDGSEALYSTFLGGSWQDTVNSIDVDSSGNACLVGLTVSDDFPISAGAVQDTLAVPGSWDLFITMLNETGSSIVYSTYLGGRGLDQNNGVHLDDQGNIYLSGLTEARDFPMVTGSFDTSHNGGGEDIYVSKLNPNATKLLYSTYIGGSGRETNIAYVDISEGFYVDSAGCVYIVGRTTSGNFPTTPSAYSRTLNGEADGFVVKVNASGSRLDYSSYLGGSGADSIHDLSVDDVGNVYMVGTTGSTDFPTSTGAYDTTLSGEYDGFVAKMNAALSRLQYSTLIGGNDNDNLRSIEVTEMGTVFVTGYTLSTDFPTTFDAIDDTHNGTVEGIIFNISSDGKELKYSTYIGGSHNDRGHNIRYHSPFITVSGWTKSTDYPTSPEAFDKSYDGDWDGFLTRIEIIPVNATPPSAPENVIIESGDRSINLTWDPPQDTGGVPLLGYNLHRGIAEDNLTIVRKLGPRDVAYKERPPILGRPMFYALSAFNYKELGNKSSIVNITKPMGTHRSHGDARMWDHRPRLVRSHGHGGQADIGLQAVTGRDHQ
jgi:hypothetical protein